MLIFCWPGIYSFFFFAEFFFEFVGVVEFELNKIAASASFEAEMSPERESSVTAGLTAGVDFFLLFFYDFAGLSLDSVRIIFSTSSAIYCSTSLNLSSSIDFSVLFLSSGDTLPLLIVESEISIGFSVFFTLGLGSTAALFR